MEEVEFSVGSCCHGGTLSATVSRNVFVLLLSGASLKRFPRSVNNAIVPGSLTNTHTHTHPLVCLSACTRSVY